MKQLFVCLLFLTGSAPVYAQQTDSAVIREAENSNRGNHSRRTAGAVFTIAGGAGLVATVLANVSSSVSNISIGPSNAPREHHSYALGYILSSGAFITGIILLATSDDRGIPSRRQSPPHRIGYGMRLEKSSLLRSSGIASASFPAVTLKIRL